MKRILLMVAVPVGLLIVWGVGRSTDQATARVDIAADQVTAMRGTVITRLEAIGAARIGESSSFSADGTSDITFRLPAARIEQALVEVDQLGGTVTDQQVDLRSAGSTAGSISQRLASLQGCLDAAEAGIRSGVATARRDLAQCQSDLRDVNSQVTASQVSLDNAELVVHIHPRSTINVIVIAVALLLVAGVMAIAVLLVRSSRTRRRVDLRATPRVVNPLDDDEIYQRRN